MPFLPLILGHLNIAKWVAIGLAVVIAIGWLGHIKAELDSIPLLKAQRQEAVDTANKNAAAAQRIAAEKDAQLAALTEQAKRNSARATTTARIKSDVQKITGDDAPVGPRLQRAFDGLRGQTTAPQGNGSPASHHP